LRVYVNVVLRFIADQQITAENICNPIRNDNQHM
jgi:hypothetical protein